MSEEKNIDGESFAGMQLQRETDKMLYKPAPGVNPSIESVPLSQVEIERAKTVLYAEGEGQNNNMIAVEQKAIETRESQTKEELFHKLNQVQNQMEGITYTAKGPAGEAMAAGGMLPGNEQKPMAVADPDIKIVPRPQESGFLPKLKSLLFRRAS